MFIVQDFNRGPPPYVASLLGKAFFGKLWRGSKKPPDKFLRAVKFSSEEIIMKFLVIFPARIQRNGNCFSIHVPCSFRRRVTVFKNKALKIRGKPFEFEVAASGIHLFPCCRHIKAYAVFRNIISNGFLVINQPDSAVKSSGYDTKYAKR